MDDVLQESYGAACVIAEMANRGTETTVDRVIRENFGNDTRNRFNVSDLKTLRRVAVSVSPNRIVRIFLGGVDPTQGTFGTPNPTILNVIDGYTLLSFSRPSRGFNGASWADAGTLTDGLGDLLSAQGYSLRLFGHSSGGIVAEAIAKLQSIHSRIELPWVVTFGAPKPGLASCCLDVSGMTRVRWMAKGDPVPIIPVGLVTSSRLLLVATAIAYQTTSQCAHGSGGILLTGTSRRPEVDAVCPAGNDRTLNDWLTGVGSAARMHSSRNYRDLLRGEIARGESLPAPASEGRVPAQSPVVENLVIPFPIPARLIPMAPPVVTRVDLDSRTFRVGAGGPTPGVQFGRDQLMARIRGTIRFVVKRPIVPGPWEVYWDTIRVASFTRMSQARTMAKRGNAWLRALGNFSTVTSAGMLAACGAFLNDAATGANGNYVPPLDVVP